MHIPAQVGTQFQVFISNNILMVYEIIARKMITGHNVLTYSDVSTSLQKMALYMHYLLIIPRKRITPHNLLTDSGILTSLQKIAL